MAQTRLTRIGKYDVEDIVGEGAMGIVYRAMDPVLGRRVAIKIMSDAIAQDTDLRERFLREAQAAGSLQHPHVVTIYDFGEVDGHLYIAMEFVEGQDLEDLFASKVAMPLDAKLELMIGVLQGLAFAHRRGVVHRDIKPANIRIDEEGKARIMDFGLAHLSSSNMTRTGVMLGTPSYMAPEQIVGGPVAPQTDIFSAGAVLYELLTGRRPFRGDALQALMYQILNSTPPPVDELVPGLPHGLNDVVMRALQKEQEDRYASALGMADDLAVIRNALGSGGVGAAHSLRASIDTALAHRRAAMSRIENRKRLRVIVATAAGVFVVGAAAVGARAMIGRASSPGAEGASASIGATQVPDPTRLTALDPAAADSASSLGDPGVPVAERPREAGPGDGSQVRPRTPVGERGAPDASRPSAAVTAPSDRELSLARSIQNAALDDRQRASDAGATPEQLRDGDAHSRVGEAHLDRGDVEAAAAAFRSAAAAWAAAERVVRRAALEGDSADAPPEAKVIVAAAADTVQRVQSEPQVPRPAAPGAPDSAAGATRPNAGSVDPTTPPAADPAAEIATVIASYARAIESRDLNELRRVYPGMSQTERRAFEEFFRATRSLRASLTVTDLHVEGVTAAARLTGTYQYVTTSGADERRPVSFQAALRRVDGVWRLTAVR